MLICILWVTEVASWSECVRCCMLHERLLIAVRRYVRVVVLPCPEATRCLFRTCSSQANNTLELNEVFAVQLSPTAFRQKTLRIDVCSTSNSRREECLVCVLKTEAFSHCFLHEFMPHARVFAFGLI